MKVQFGLEGDGQSELSVGLNKVLANTYSLYINTLNCHWNIEDPSFIALHEMFQSQYEDLAEAGDLLGERLRQMGEKVPASLRFFAENSSFEDIDEHASAKQMITQLASFHEKAIISLRDLSDIAEKYKDYGLVDLLGSLLREHEKTAWFLRSHVV